MGNNEQSQAVRVEKTLKNRCISILLGINFRFEKIARTMVNLFVPWVKIYQLKSIIQRIKNENYGAIAQQNVYSGQIAYGEISGMLNWPELLDDVGNANGFTELIRLLNLSMMSEKEGIVRSNCWVLLATKNLNQLLGDGYHHFKRTIGHNYFNFLVQKGDPQIHAAEALFPAETREACWRAAASVHHDPAFNAAEQTSYYYFIYILWEYVKRIDKLHYLDRLEEPKEGNPILVSANGKSMSQDLVNSLIEYYSMSEAVEFNQVKRVLEIGGGYGRTAHVILSLNPEAKVYLVDIMPALYIAQRYLSSVFRDRKVFRAKNFSSYDEIKDEMESCSIVFLLPHQLSMFPDGYFDVSMNISSFGEMNIEQIKYYYAQINRLTSQYFYTKQWKLSKNPFDDLLLKKDDYPAYVNWKSVYSRDCVIQRDFFETLYQVNNG